jgi:soluble lytic murein transglycosylase-like protein
LNVNEVDPEILTTYAGLLLRDLLDRFNGDVSLAIGAYNGGPGNPNMKYHEGVQAAALHARRVLEQAAALNGESVMRIPWLTAR